MDITSDDIINALGGAKYFDDPNAFDESCKVIRFSKRMLSRYIEKTFNADIVVVTSDVTLFRSDNIFEVPVVIHLPAGTVLSGYKSKLAIEPPDVIVIPYLCCDSRLRVYVNKKQLAEYTADSYSIRVDTS